MNKHYTGYEGMMVVGRIVRWLRSAEAEEVVGRASANSYPGEALADAIEQAWSNPTETARQALREQQ